MGMATRLGAVAAGSLPLRYQAQFFLFLLPPRLQSLLLRSVWCDRWLIYARFRDLYRCLRTACGMGCN